MKANILQFGAKSPRFDRRRFLRAVRAALAPRPLGQRFRILDISRHGMAIEAEHPFSIEGLYLFEMVDQGRSVVVEGEVRWCEATSSDPPTYRVGLAFVAIKARASLASTEHLATLPVSVEEQLRDKEDLLADRINRLEKANSPDEAAEALLELLSPDFEHLVLFRIAGNTVLAWLGCGPTLVPERLKKLRLELNQASIFLHLREGGHFFYGYLPAMFAHLQILRCWNGSLNRECVLFPVRLGERLVAVLYADAGDRGLLAEHLGNLQGAVELFTRSLLDQILRRKSSTSESPSQ